MREYAEAHDDAIWACFTQILCADTEEERREDPIARRVATLPGRLGGLGLRSARRDATSAYLAAWLDALPVLAKRQPDLAQSIVNSLDGGDSAASQPGSLQELCMARAEAEAAGCTALPPWSAQVQTPRAAPPMESGEDADDADPGEFRRGWQHHISSILETRFRNVDVLPTLPADAQAMLRSQSGPGAARWLAARPTCPAREMPSLAMQIGLRRRLRWPLPACARWCNGAACRKTLDARGDHRAACALSGRLKRRSRPLERTWARVCREAGARVVENFYLRNSSVPVSPRDGRCVEILATGLPFYRGVPLAIDATMVSVLHADGSVWGAAAGRDGTAILRAERAKALAYPELVNSSILRLVTVACEVGGRWSSEARALLQSLAAAKARSAPPPLQRAARGAWQRRWGELLSVSQQRALAATLVDAVPQDLDGVDGEAPPIGCVCTEAA